ncbi:hypothetical protein [Streptantibioticus silvisoli]|uniref:ABC transporter permease n=1 Tax=Streptantibioticus silvisoli TaxID=2705255 RepID=A0ABT6W646_9ACTN|nr:hypothetical protein [Streptantibioticus silvisoli]MDI5966222.1 hypothetical protein [Streptantibioticus silvisoli]
MSAVTETGEERAADWAEEDDWTTEALALLRDVRSPHRRKRAGQVGYVVYCVLLLIGVWVALPSTGYFLQQSEGADFSGHGPAVLAAIPSGACAVGLGWMLLMARDAVWRGPVVPARESVDWLLAQPVRVSRVLRPWWWTSAGVSAALGVLVAALGMVVLGLTCRVGLAAGFGWCLVGCAGVPLLAAGIAVLVEGSVRASLWVRRLFPYGALLVVGLAAQAVLAVGGHRLPGLERAELWSGPWGWAGMAALSPTRAAVPGGGVAAVALVVLALALVVTADRTVGRLALSVVRQRSRTATGVINALGTTEFRAARQVVAAASGEAPGARWRLPAPRRTWLAVPWRDTLALLRVPGRLGRAVVMAVPAVLGGVLAAGTHGAPGLLASAVALAFAYWSLTQLVEPARLETDDTRRGAWAPYPFRDLMLRHTAVPVLLGLLLSVPVLWALLAEGAGVRALLAPGVVPPLVGAALVNACRGAAKQNLLFSPASSSPTGSMGPLVFLAWYGAGALVGVVTLVIPLVVALHAGTVASVLTALIGDAVVTAVMVRWAVMRMAKLTT